MFVPALAIDWLVQHMKDRNKLLVALAAGSAFLVVTVAVHWFYARFMISPLAKTWVFGTAYFPYMQPPSSYHFSCEFFHEPARVFGQGLAIAWITAVVSAAIGLQCGEWLGKFKR